MVVALEVVEAVLEEVDLLVEVDAVLEVDEVALVELLVDVALEVDELVLAELLVDVVVLEVVVLLVVEVELLVDLLVLLLVVLPPEYVEPLKVSTYWLIAVATCCPGLLNSPTANPISTVEPTASDAVGSCGKSLVSANGR